MKFLRWRYRGRTENESVRGRLSFRPCSTLGSLACINVAVVAGLALGRLWVTQRGKLGVFFRR